MTEPTDRSMPPPMMTKVMPTVMTPMTEACVRIVTMLSRVGNVSGWVIQPITNSTMRTTTRPRLRISPTLRKAPPRVLAVCTAALSTLACSSAGGLCCSVTPHFLP